MREERLEAYRGAVAAHLYSDWDGSAEATDNDVLAWLRALGPRVGFPFTDAELERLEACRAAVGAGYYSEVMR